MSFQKAYNTSVGRKDLEYESIDDHEKLLIQDELKRWLDLSKTKELLLFLAKRELDLLNAARNSSKISLKNDNTDRNLLKSLGIREVIDYILENKQPD